MKTIDGITKKQEEITKKKEVSEPVFISGQPVPLDILTEVVKFLPACDLGSYAQSSSAFFKVACQEAEARKKYFPIVSPRFNLFRRSIQFCSQDNNYLTFYPYGNFDEGALQKNYQPEKFTSMDQGAQHAILLSEEGKIYIKGLAVNATLEHVTGFNEDEKIILVAAGSSTNYALTHQGTLYAWGCNDYGQVGMGHEQDCATPQKIMAFENKKIINIAVGFRHVLALSDEGKVYAWGRNDQGQLGLNTSERSYNIPQEISFFKDMQINAIYAAAGHSLVIAEKEVFAFGSNRYNQLGLGQAYPVYDIYQDLLRIDRRYPFYKSPQSVPALRGTAIVMLATSFAYTLALTANGELLAWGRNIHNSKTCIPDPLKLEAFKSQRVLAVFAQDDDYLVLTTNKKVYFCNTLSEHAKLELISNQEAAESLRKAILASSAFMRDYALLKALAGDPLDEKVEFKTYSKPGVKCIIS